MRPLRMEITSRWLTYLGVASAIVVFSLPAAAQDVNPEPTPKYMALGQGPEAGEPGAGPFLGERIELLGFGGVRGGKVVTGSPFTATAVSESTQTLSDGNKITRKTQTSLYRDSQGRFRKEVTLRAIGLFAATGHAKSLVVIQDPVAGKSFLLDGDRKTARELPNAKWKFKPQKDAKWFRKMNSASDADVQKEDLGTQTINGVSAQGTRYTRTIPAGQIGNEKPITIVSETWYSPDLQMLVMSKRSDPRFGDTTYQLTNIQRGEPDAALFQVPSDYTIKTGPPAKHFFRKRGDAPPPPGDAPPPGL